MRQVIALADLFLFIVEETVASSLRISWDIITPRARRSPGIVEVPIDLKHDKHITLLALLVTLTPGSVSLDVSTDRRSLYVHGMFASDPQRVKRDVKEGFERRIRRLVA